VDTEVGVLTIGSAAIDDAVAWCLLILVISILHSTNMVTALYVFLVVRLCPDQRLVRPCSDRPRGDHDPYPLINNKTG
jgi:Kef-type K+ transport system membrane component KefB